MQLGLCGHYVGGRNVRGVCRPCYDRYLKQVTAGQVTWAQLEEAGKVSKPTPKGELSNRFFKQRR